MAVLTRIKNNQVTDASAGNVYLGVNAAAKVQDYSITGGKIQNNLTYGSDLTITGNLTVQGNTTTIDTVNLVVEDPLILLAKEQTGSPTLDIGFIGKRGTSDNIAFVWDESADQFVAVFTTSETTNTVININSYASLQVLDLTAATANVAGNVVVGNISVTGNITGAANFSGNVSASNFLTTGIVSATGNVTGGNVLTGGLISATGNVTSGNVNTGIVSASGNILGGNVSVTGNVTAQNFIGNISGNIDAAGANTNVQFNDDDLLNGSANFTFDKATNVMSVTGTIQGTTVSATGNVIGGNVSTAGLVTATGNVTGGNLTTAGVVTATGNVTGGNVLTGGVVSATANVTGGNILTSGLMSATGNVTGGNLITAGLVSSATLNTTGNAVIGGNLIVQGNLTYNNVDDLRVEDPVIIMGTGPNGAPLTVDDDMDRGIYMEYFITGLGNAFMGFQNATGNLIAAANVSFASNNVISVVEYGTLQAGNAYLQSAVATGNVTGGNINTGGLVQATGNVNSGNVNTTLVSATGNVIAGNVSTAGLVTATGNVTGGNILTGGLISATGNVTSGNVNTGIVSASGNILGGNVSVTGNVTASYFIGNISGNIDAAGANTQVQFNDTGDLLGASANFTFDKATNIMSVTGTVQGTTVSATGNVIGGNVSTAGLITATGNITGANLILTSGTIDGPAAGRITINASDLDTDFAIDGDSTPNVFYVDAGVGTASFGNSGAIANAIVSFNTADSIKMPVGNTAQRPDPAVVGMTRFSTAIDALELYTSTGWEAVGVPAFTVIVADDFSGTGACTTFTLSQDSTTASTIVSINGVVQIPTTAYSVTGNSLVFTEAPEVSDVIDARILTTTTTVTAIENVSANAAVEALNTAATVQITGNLLPAANVTYDIGSNAFRWNDAYFNGTTITLGNIQIKNSTGTTIGFFGPDGTTPATIDSTNIDTTSIANGNSNMTVIASGGNIRANVGGSSIITITSGGIINNMGNGVGNIGNATGFFNTIFAKATSAQYADLAEMYVADQMIEPGTVVCFGGDYEVTICDTDSCSRVAGVVSTNPSYIMNAGLAGDNVVAVALTGRVPTRVTGQVRKGDMMVSTADGRARAATTPTVGQVIGKALADFDGTDGVIEVVVGRL
jgi:hypothetical protein